MEATRSAPRNDALFPARTKVLVMVLVAALLLGALVLIGVRAEALMIDLAKIGQPSASERVGTRRLPARCDKLSTVRARGHRQP